MSSWVPHGVRLGSCQQQELSINGRFVHAMHYVRCNRSKKAGCHQSLLNTRFSLSLPLATSLPQPAMEGQTRLPNRLHALASVAAGRRAARCRPESRARARDMSSRCGGPGPRVGATHGSTGQPALRTSDGGRHPEVGAAPPGARGHGTNEMPPVYRQVLHKRGNAGTPGVARSAAAAPVDDKEAASNILQGRAQRSPWHALYARRTPPQAANHADGDKEAPRAAPGTSGAAQQGSILAGLAPLAPLWAPLGTGSPHPMAPAHPGALAAPADPGAMPIRDG